MNHIFTRISHICEQWIYRNQKWRHNTFTVAPKKMEHVSVHWTKQAQDLYTERDKMLMKEIKGPNQWRDVWCSCTGRLSSEKWQFYTNDSAGLMQLLSASQQGFSADRDKWILKLMWKATGPRVPRTIMAEEWSGKHHLPIIKTYYRGTVIKTGCWWGTDIQSAEHNRGSRTDPCS